MTTLNEVFTNNCAEAQLGNPNRYSPGFAYFRHKLAGIIISGFVPDQYAYISHKIGTLIDLIAIRWQGVGNTETLKHNLAVRRRKLCKDCLLYKTKACSGFDTQAGTTETGEEVVEYIPKISKKPEQYLLN